MGAGRAQDRLLRRIAQSGPLSVAEFMTEALLHPEFGYYMKKPAIGRGGDFVTAPEVSQIFGEMIGLWLVQVWSDQGRPSDVNLVELGGGRGTLMADILRAAKLLPEFTQTIRLHMVEASPLMRAAQAEALGQYQPQFHDTIATLPDGPLYLVANEFFDALPIRQFQKARDGWHERQIGADQGALIWGLGPVIAPDWITARFGDMPEGAIVEVNAAAEAIASDIGRRIDAHGGAALLIDYGDWISSGDTFQAVKDHRYADPLVDIGTSDLTAHVAFQPLAASAAPARAAPLQTQGLFLERLGITARAQALAQKLHGAALQSHIAAHRRLTHPEEMGQLFKVLGLTQQSAPALPGLDDLEIRDM